MVAVLLVFSTHLFGWPRGGFIGVDVFFVISGFLITGNLLRMAENTGNVSFRKFYWNRVRRIVPAATVVLVLTYLASILVFRSFRAHQVGVDALFAFIFMSNWWFAIRGTDYFTAGDAVSPVQHYWSLSIEEQFYFVWPALIFVIGLIVARKAWTHDHRMRLTGASIGAVIAVSLGWALYETASSPTWAYFNTLTRAWELGVGALLATMVGALTRIPVNAKPWLSWGGLGLIAASVVLIAEGSGSFPAPWALLPVAGSAMVIAAGVDGEPRYQGFLSNPFAVYIGNISYSLYLVHWPVIVILGALMKPTGGRIYFYVAVVSLAFALAIMSYHFVENPLRYGRSGKLRQTILKIRRGSFGRPTESTRYAAASAMALLTLGLAALMLQPPSPPKAPPQATGGDRSRVDGPQPVAPKLEPLEAALQLEIAQAVSATQWPSLDPSDPTSSNPVNRAGCGARTVDNPQECTWGSPDAPVRAVLVGDSMAVGYGGPLRELALNSGGKFQLRVAAMNWCDFTYGQLADVPDQAIKDACTARKQQAIDFINSTKPDVVIISNRTHEENTPIVGDGGVELSWNDSITQIVSKFRGSTKKLVWISPPPMGSRSIQNCPGNRSMSPADCIDEISGAWFTGAENEQAVAQYLDGVWIDSSPWFCSSGNGLCPAFVGSTSTMFDFAHMTPNYGELIYPVIGEALTTAGVLPDKP